MMLPIVALPSHINDQSRESLTDMIIGQSDLGDSPIRAPSSHVTRGARLTIKTNYSTQSQKIGENKADAQH